MNPYDWSYVDDEPWPVYLAPASHTRLAVFLVAAALVAVLLLRRTLRA